MNTGRKPFTGETRQATINAILSTQPNSVINTNPELPPDLDRILNKALDKDRELRYQTASDFRADLRRLLREIDSSASGSGAVRIEPAEQTRWLWTVIATFLVLMTAALGWLVWLKAKNATADWSHAAHLQLTNEHGTEFFPSLAPDGKSFVYASNQSGNYDLLCKESVARMQRRSPQTRLPTRPSRCFRRMANGSLFARRANRQEFM